MKRLLNGLLALTFAVSLYLLVVRDVASFHLSAWGDLWLRILAAASGQWFVCRVSRTELPRILPATVCSLLSVLGFFLLLTYPSWQHVTFGGFMRDYAVPTAVCWVVWWLYQRYYK